MKSQCRNVTGDRCVVNGEEIPTMPKSLAELGVDGDDDDDDDDAAMLLLPSFPLKAPLLPPMFMKLMVMVMMMMMMMMIMILMWMCLMPLFLFSIRNEPELGT